MIKKLEKMILNSALVAYDTKPTEPIPKSPNPLAFFKWYGNEIEWVTSQIDLLEEKYGTRNSCKNGCSSCCKQAIAVSSIEMIALIPVLKNLGRDQLETLHEKTKWICDKIKNSGMNFNIKSFTNKTRVNQCQKEYFSLGINCPLLDENASCLVYSVRPTNCWSYRVYGDPEECLSSYDAISGIKFNEWEKIILDRIFQAKKPSKVGLRLLPFALDDLIEDIRKYRI